MNKMLTERRHDVDAIRVIVLFLLIGYHSAVAFQPWGWTIGFITNDKPLNFVWNFFMGINTWRIPILFVISGMALRYSFENRDKLTLFNERTKIILLPYYFGFLTAGLLHSQIFLNYVRSNENAEPNAAHLWFLGNIAIYAFLCIPMMNFLTNNKSTSENISKILNSRFGMFFFSLPFLIEGWLQESLKLAWGVGWTMYVGTLHGLLLGLICFISGILLVSQGDVFWDALKRNMPIHLTLAVGLFVNRFIGGFESTGGVLIAFESYNFMFAVFGLGQRYLNKQSTTLDYLKEAVFPVYIFHMPLQQFIATFIIPSNLSPYLKFSLLVISTLAGSFLLFELVKRVKLIRPLFGLRNPPSEEKKKYLTKGLKIFYYSLAIRVILEFAFGYGLILFMYMFPNI